MQPDVWTMSTGVNHARAVGLCGLSRNVWVALHAARHRRPVNLRETTRSDAIAHVTYISRTNNISH